MLAVNSFNHVRRNQIRENMRSAAKPVSREQVPVCLLADDATSADQIALSVCETLGGRVITTDARSLSQKASPLDESCVWVVNSGTRALSRAEAQVRNQQLAARFPSGESNLPLLQIDSRLRGIGNALRGFYESLDCAFLLFVPAEPELGRLVEHSHYYHVEAGRLRPFHESVLAKPEEHSWTSSDLREFIAAELGILREQVVSIDTGIMTRGPDAVLGFLRGLQPQGKFVLMPDVCKPEDFEAVISAKLALSREKILVAGSRTFLRAYFAAVAANNTKPKQATLLSASIDRRIRSAPLAVVCSLEPAMNSQVEYARQALGPNLVAVVFDSSVIRAGDQAIRREVDRAQHLVLQGLKAMRPVLLQSSRDRIAEDPVFQQAHLNALGKVVAHKQLPRQVSSLFISGGQTAEMIRNALGISAVEMKGAFREGIPWGLALEGSFKSIPLVTKGGRLGRDEVLFEFFEQGHPLPRANILPVVTPLTSDRQIDEAGIEKLIHHLVFLGATDIFAVGNAGEFRFLTNEQRLRALERFARKAQGKLRVFAGVTGDDAEETRRNYQEAGRLGVFAAVIMPLYFLGSSEEIAPFVESLRSVPSGLPLVLYNNPARTQGQNISFEAVEALPFPVVALKDSSGDLDRLDRYARALPVYQGQQRQFLEGYLHGARGTVGIIGHVSPLPNEFFVPATTTSRREAIARCINDLSKTVKQGGAEVAAYKFLLSLMGVMGDTVGSTEPARQLTAAQREAIRASNIELVSNARMRPV
ncbi:MAG TPA: dihydrodipicolinate synthase family protein [Verrucomicrobiota bacterium]|nr:dihydrodipicolinate synthase family protein [Verrucomicrobiota bacterium]